ncbi:hypothetical protein [Actinomadura algeriensis]|uniref:Lipoprotein n=1 Tax=Actinomadura algeriensis TaxID=1679523 RepID=A0ABR9JIU7_9ACTN|nr:hypothetical protein [Actinomadura algeriensis]MBE1530484.1 hypothetical protein [Actinomadura algeriensis]
MQTDSGRAVVRRRARRRRPVVTMAAAVAAAGLLAGACGGDGGGGAAGRPATGGNDPLAYATCMRENGVPNFPDPDSDGRLAIDGSKVDMDSPVFRSAQEKCKKFDPPPPPEPAADREAALEYAKCMRENGIPNFPDPDAEGKTDIDAGSGIDLDGAVYKKADETCKEVLVHGGEQAGSGG